MPAVPSPRHSSRLGVPLSALLLLAALLIIAPPTVTARADGADSAAPKKLHVILCEWIPYSYVKHGVITGLVTDVIRATLDQAGFRYTVTMLPWARAYKTVQETPNAVTPLFRQPQRDDMFKWVRMDGMSVSLYLFRPAQRTDIVIKTLDDARQYRIGVTRANSVHHYLLSKGFKDEVNLFPVNRERLNLQKSRPDRDRLDLTSGDIRTYSQLIDDCGMNPNAMEPVFKLFEQTLYLAVPPDTPDSEVQRLREAYRQIREKGIVEQALARYDL